jgi:RNA polymerase sigma factor (sigma-70 family)
MRAEVSKTPGPNNAWIHDVVDEFEQRLTLYAARLLHDADRARDVVQDTFCKLCHESRDKIEGHLTQWLFTVCRNKALDVLRKEKRIKPMSDAQLESGRSSEPSPVHAAEYNEDTSRVMAAIDTLPERQQEIVRLKFQHGMSYRQISAITSESVSNVGYLLHNALRDLRAHLSGDRQTATT